SHASLLSASPVASPRCSAPDLLRAEDRPRGRTSWATESPLWIAGGRGPACKDRREGTGFAQLQNQWREEKGGRSNVCNSRELCHFRQRNTMRPAPNQTPEAVKAICSTASRFEACVR